MNDLVDQPLIAERLNVPRDTVQKWRSRGVLPLPDYPELSTPIWDWETIEEWATNTGRLKVGFTLSEVVTAFEMNTRIRETYDH